MKKKTNISVYIVTHKRLRHYIKKRGYCYIGVGTKKTRWKKVQTYDDFGPNNIASKNPSYCELTAQYWINENDCSDFLGLVHYRRFFGKNFIYSTRHFKKLLSQHQMIVAERAQTSSVLECYSKYHYYNDLIALKEAAISLYPDIKAPFEEVLKETSFSPYNMFISNRKIFGDYSSVLFKVLLLTEERIDISHYDVYQKRVYGFLGEIFLNVFIKWKKIDAVELPVKFIDECSGPKSRFRLIISKVKHFLRPYK